MVWKGRGKGIVKRKIGVSILAHHLEMKWVVIKGISGYPDETEAEENWKTFASVMAASVVISIVNDCSIFGDWPHYKDSIPIYIKARGTAGLIAYWRALEEGQTYDRRTKIVLIGQDRTGKTSLRRYLRGEAFDKDEASTDGIEMISPVKSAGEGAWRNPAALENTSALDHKCAEITKEILNNSTNPSDRAQPPTEVGNKTRGEPTVGQKATEERVRDPLLIRPSSKHSSNLYRQGSNCLIVIF
ncbi:hypothetical protein AWC38_SpisGene21301 [Stylophora pistillata]|uniref:Uncharacterized protein n=1 Tax=Stylophora pistillata TaxID=50429 RepID=A0A2B4RCM5_STYPI|nr:hypothetical protein AWC38_SpisGene21301 [Stylophora pistillata]